MSSGPFEGECGVRELAPAFVEAACRRTPKPEFFSQEQPNVKVGGAVPAATVPPSILPDIAARSAPPTITFRKFEAQVGGQTPASQSLNF